MSTPVLLSPVTGKVLQPDGPDLMRDADGCRWPVIDGIPYLRVGRDALVQEAVDRLRAGDRDGALVALLGDQDAWWTGARPAAEALRELVRRRAALSLRDAMGLLAFGRVGDYFAHRWSDPTFLAGLALLEAHWRPAATSFELACGIGHYGRELARRGVSYSGGDVVFAKLWLARHWVVPATARLVCFDAAASWPVAGERHDLVLCHDAFYFLEPKAEILARLRDLAGPAGRLVIGHVHNQEADNLSAGHALATDEVARLFPGAAVYDDAELTRSLVEARAPVPAAPAALATAEAFGIEDRPLGAPQSGHAGGFAMPPRAAPLRLNPLYRPDHDGWSVAWPSDRYKAEYAARAPYPARLSAGEGTLLTALAQQGGGAPRDGATVSFDEAVRRRVLVDLPESW